MIAEQTQAYGICRQQSGPSSFESNSNASLHGIYPRSQQHSLQPPRKKQGLGEQIGKTPHVHAEPFRSSGGRRDHFRCLMRGNASWGLTFAGDS